MEEEKTTSPSRLYAHGLEVSSTLSELAALQDQLNMMWSIESAILEATASGAPEAQLNMLKDYKRRFKAKNDDLDVLRAKFTTLAEKLRAFTPSQIVK